MLIPEIRQVTKNRTKSLFTIFVVCFSALLITTIAMAQSKKPISKNGLLEAIGLNALTTQELVEQVRSQILSALDEQHSF